MLRRWISHVSHTPHHSHRDAATVETSDSIQLYRCRPYPGRNERVKSKRDRATTEEKKNDRSHSVPGCDDEIHFVLSILKFKIIQEKCCNYRLAKLLLFVIRAMHMLRWRRTRIETIPCIHTSSIVVKLQDTHHICRLHWHRHRCNV